MDDPLKIIGTNFDGYAIQERVGEGASGYVYRATKAGETFALKVYKQWLFERAARDKEKRIKREAAVQKVVHENVCRVFGFRKFDHQGVTRRYLVMELLEGEPLHKLIKRLGPLDFTLFRSIARRIIDGLAALHREGIIHRDVKPQNVLVDLARDRVVVADFGVVADLEAATLTSKDTFLGTLVYSAPEWIRREPPDAADSPAIDVYGLGATFCEMLSGHPPFDAGMNEYQLAEAIKKDLPRFQPTQPCPQEIERLVRYMLAKEPSVRPTLEHCARALSDATGISGTLPTTAPAESADPLQRFAQALRGREDIRQEFDKRAAAREWDRVRTEAQASVQFKWKRAKRQFRATPGVASADWVVAPVERRHAMGNFKELQALYPERTWDWDFGLMVRPEPGVGLIGVHVAYFIQGSNSENAEILRYVATFTSEVVDGSHGRIELATVAS